MLESLTPLLLSAFLLGLFGSIHCIAMCGGIAGALGQTQSGQSPGMIAFRTALYSGGRISSYAVAGAIVGSFGEAFAQHTGLTVLLRCLAGLLILAFGLHIAGWWNGISRLEKAGLVLWRRIAPLSKRIGRPDRSWKVLVLGMLWGWLPCGLVYSALAGAAATGKASFGIAFMIAFGFGTLPALLPISAVASRLGQILSRPSSRQLAGAILLCFGLWSIGGAVLPILGHDGHTGHPDHRSHR